MTKKQTKKSKKMRKRAFLDLDAASVGRPITRNGVSFFPVYLRGNDLPKIATGPKAKRVIEEMDDASVPDLNVTNPGKKPLLLVEGEQFIGGLQNRTINVNVLIPPGETLKIPVSCLEQGRWGRRRNFKAAQTRTPIRVRRVLNEALAAQAGTPEARSGAQREVWNEVEGTLNRLQAESPTAAVSDADAVFRRERGLGEAAKELGRLGPLPGQCGFVVTHGSRVIGTEIFGAPGLLRRHWKAMVRSYLLEPPRTGGFPSADMALRALWRIGESRCTASPGLGLGEERHYSVERGVGQALVLDGALVAASALSR